MVLLQKHLFMIIRKYNKFKRFLFFKYQHYKDFLRFKKSIKNNRQFGLTDEFYHTDRFKSFDVDYHYLYHPVWAFNLITKNSPKKHIDVSSINYFPAFLSVVIPTVYYEYRKPNFYFSNLTVLQGDLLNLPLESESVDSISCMHTLEHIGLGRYGDIIDYDGDLKAARELDRVVKKDGLLYLVVPVGKPKIVFNRHRIYSYEMIVEMFCGFQLIEFSIVWDDGSFQANANPSIISTQNYSCGCFCFRKK